jgi:hypothetical protein
MARNGRRWVGAQAAAVGLVGLLALTPEWSRAGAAEGETRDFTVLVDGKHAGQYHLFIGRQDDGAFVINGQANVSLRYLVHHYTYVYNGTEAWKDGRLYSLKSTCNDDGKRYQVTATADGNTLRVQVNGHERTTRPDVWVTSYWHLPDARFRNAAVPLLDADSGKDISGRLQYIGTSQVTVGGQVQNCAHYRVTEGTTPVDLWYDSQERLVRRDYVEDGHRTILELTAVRH